MEIAGVQVIEIAEMDALLKATPSAAKAFLDSPPGSFSSALWSARDPSASAMCVRRHDQSARRRTIFDGSNRSATIWPVACRDMIDLDGLRAARDQLWAEAVGRFYAGEKWWLETPQLEALATVGRMHGSRLILWRSWFANGWAIASTLVSGM